jgi:hypothetical protein
VDEPSVRENAQEIGPVGAHAASPFYRLLWAGGVTGPARD